MKAREDPQRVVLVHGIWLNGMEFTPLARRLEREGFLTTRFVYPSVRGTPAANADRLAAFLGRLDPGRVHIVAHSLGTILVSHLVARQPGIVDGRVVFIGGPVRGSAVARRAAVFSPLRRLLGNATDQGLLGGAPPWPRDLELGVLAGDLPLGVGRFVGGLPGSNDGTVAVEETRVAGAADFRVLHGSHMGLLWTRATAECVVSFLRTGRFSRLCGYAPS